MQRKVFEDQMRALERKQAQELLNLPYDPIHGSIQHLAASAPTTPPRVNAILSSEVFPSGRSGRVQFTVDAEILSKAVGTVSDKRKSVTYAPSINISSGLAGSAANGQAFSRPAGAKSMPASRRTSASSHDEELAGHLQNLALVGERSNRASPAPVGSALLSAVSRHGENEGSRFTGVYNAGMLLDEQLDKEMNNAMRNLPISDDDKPQAQGPYSGKVGHSYTYGPCFNTADDRPQCRRRRWILLIHPRHHPVRILPFEALKRGISHPNGLNSRPLLAGLKAFCPGRIAALLRTRT
jgi:hypothetical protein